MIPAFAKVSSLSFSVIYILCFETSCCKYLKLSRALMKLRTMDPSVHLSAVWFMKLGTTM